jgi:hypothetical protein
MLKVPAHQGNSHSRSVEVELNWNVGLWSRLSNSWKLAIQLLGWGQIKLSKGAIPD